MTFWSITMPKKLSEFEVKDRFARLVASYPTQKDFGDAVGFTESYICRLLNYDRPLPDKICEMIGVRRTTERVVTYEEVV